MQVQAAVVHSFDRPPHYESFDVPEPSGPHRIVADVVATALHPRVRSAATGTHYTSTGELPMIPGVDGVARLSDGGFVYFVAADDAPGPMATRTVLDPRRTIPLPAGVDLTRIAAGMNPAMSSWVALRRQAPIEPGQSVLVLGATGNAGRMAIQVARRLGAGRVIGAGRDRVRLAELKELGADAAFSLDDSSATLPAPAAEVDLVLDYLWGKPTGDLMMELLRKRSDRSRALSWVQIGSVAGPTIHLPSMALRSANLRLLGSGQGAVSAKAYLEELPALVEEINSGAIAVTARTEPLSEVEAVWTAPEPSGTRTVFVP